MMKAKEYIILGVIIVLLGVYLFLRSDDRSQYQLPALPDAAADEITRIEITAPGQSIELTRSGDQWQIGEHAYPVDETKAKEMLSVLEKLKLTALVSETGAYSRYDLNDDKKIGVRAWAGDRMVRDFAVGKTADTYQHTFVRLGEDPNVYHASSNFRQTFDKTVESLRDKTALSFTAPDISGINIVSGANHLSLTLETPPAEETPSQEVSAEKASEPAEAVWMKEDGTPADADAVKRLLSQLAYLNCSGYLNDKKKEDFSNPVYTVTLKGAQIYSLSLFEKKDDEMECPGISSQNDYPFNLSDTACSRLTETLEKIMGTETDA